MISRLLRVAGRTVILLFAASVVIFALLRAIPGNPAEVALGVSATPEAVAALTTQLGLDRPLTTQYASWIAGMLRGDFGTSLASSQPITPILLDRLQVSAILCGLAMALSLAIAVPCGIIAAGGLKAQKNSLASTFSAVSYIGIAVPSFLVGVGLVAIFAVHLGWLPANGWVPPNAGVWPFLRHLILPVTALAAVQAAILTRYVRSAVLDIANRDYMRTAAALGFSPARAMARHGLRNAAIPVLTVAGLQLASLIVGAVVIERVFVIPGLGSMLLDAVTSRDLITVQAVVMVLVVATLLVNLAVDVTTTLIDPRLRSNKGARQ